MIASTFFLVNLVIAENVRDGLSSQKVTHLRELATVDQPEATRTLLAKDIIREREIICFRSTALLVGIAPGRSCLNDG
jgi:hypothetical protein